METNFISQGWQCPICKNVWAPFVQECFNCNNKKSFSDKITIDWAKSPITTKQEYTYYKGDE